MADGATETRGNRRKVREGIAVQIKMDKTVVVAVVKPGRVLFELSGVPEPVAREAMRLAIHKLPIKARFIMREDEGA